MSTQDMFSIVAILYCVTNLGSMGLELNLQETIKSLRSPRLVILTLVWSWILGSAAAFPVQDPNVLVMILLAVPVPLAVWLLLARYFFAPRADKDLVKV